jgi:hypothetical protein
MTDVVEMIEAWEETKGRGMSTNRLLFYASAAIVAAVIALYWPRIQECFFTSGQTCECPGSTSRFKSLNDCKIVRFSN